MKNLKRIAALALTLLAVLSCFTLFIAAEVFGLYQIGKGPVLLCPK